MWLWVVKKLDVGKDQVRERLKKKPNKTKQKRVCSVVVLAEYQCAKTAVLMLSMTGATGVFGDKSVVGLLQRVGSQVSYSTLLSQVAGKPGVTRRKTFTAAFFNHRVATR